jgi:hypothetical protein
MPLPGEARGLYEDKRNRETLDRLYPDVVVLHPDDASGESIRTLQTGRSSDRLFLGPFLHCLPPQTPLKLTLE